MNRHIRFSILVSLGCCAAMSGAAAQGRVRTAVKESARDAAITARIETTYLFDRNLNPFNINTTTRDGSVTITGSVADEIQRELAEQIAASVEGVVGVTNKITVVGTFVSLRPKRTWLQRIDDLSLAATVRSRLLYHKGFKGLKISVTSELSYITLHGVVASKEQKERIGKIVHDTKSVLGVKNNLTVRSKGGIEDAADVGQRFSEEWTEKRVEAALVFNRYLSVRDLSVEIDDGVCILTGVVDIDEQKDLAAAVAASIRGVDSIRNEIRIYKPNY